MFCICAVCIYYSNKKYFLKSYFCNYLEGSIKGTSRFLQGSSSCGVGNETDLNSDVHNCVSLQDM